MDFGCHRSRSCLCVFGIESGIDLRISLQPERQYLLLRGQLEGQHRFLPDPWIRRMCLSGEAFTAADIRLDYCAGATLCEPGTTEQAAAAVFESFSRIDPAFLERAKRRLAHLLSTLALT